MLGDRKLDPMLNVYLHESKLSLSSVQDRADCHIDAEFYQALPQMRKFVLGGLSGRR